MTKLVQMGKLMITANKRLKNAPGIRSKGFTLIELLVVIAVIGILAAALLLAIDPIDKINAGNDTKVINDTRAIHDAALRYYTNNYTLPTNANWTTLLVPTELKSTPVPPTGYAASYTFYPNAAGDDVSVCANVKSKANLRKAPTPGTTAVVYVSNGKQCFVNTATCQASYYACP